MHHGGALPRRLELPLHRAAAVVVVALFAVLSIGALAPAATAQDDENNGRGSRDESEQTIDDLDCDDLEYNEAIIADCGSEIIAERRQELVDEGALDPLPEGDDGDATQSQVDNSSADAEDGDSGGSGGSGDESSNSGDGSGSAAGGRIGSTSTSSGAGTSVALGAAAAGLAAAGGLLAAGRRRRGKEVTLASFDADITPPASLPSDFAYDATQERITPDPTEGSGHDDADPNVGLAQPPAAIVLPAESDVPVIDVPGIDVPGIEIPGTEGADEDPDEST